MSTSQEQRDENVRKALQKAAFERAREKDDRAENGITGRVDFMLDQINKENEKK